MGKLRPRLRKRMTWAFSFLQQEENICSQVSPIQGELGKGPVGRFGKAA